MLASPLGERLPGTVVESGWLGFDPATDVQIAEAESRLKIALPPSFRVFVRISNGWRQTTFAIERVWGTEEISWFRKKHREWIAAYSMPASFEPREESPNEEYFSYERSEDFRLGHLRETLQISDVGDSAVYLLNPQVITKDGEWEAWLFANWIPGVRRYRSFLEMMQAEYCHFARVEWKRPLGLIGGLPDEYVGSPGSVKRHLKKKRREPKALGRRLSEWTVDELVEMLRQTDFPPFRQEIADILGRLCDPRAIDPLMSMLNEDSNASVSAIYAVKRLAPDRLTEPLLRLLQERHSFAFHAAAVLLAERAEERAVPILVEVLKDPQPEARHLADYVGGQIALFGQSGLDALVELLKNEQLFVRVRAAQGLSYSHHPHIRGVFENLLDDPAPKIRQIAAQQLAILPRRHNDGEGV